ncbi:uncharacterized protein [Ptychodera flava]|uniref:uncharacterized protein n=1 Tax=Ptychodera flava TaxID=63121 RepID=UPI00396A8A23
MTPRQLRTHSYSIYVYTSKRAYMRHIVSPNECEIAEYHDDMLRLRRLKFISIKNSLLILLVSSILITSLYRRYFRAPHISPNENKTAGKSGQKDRLIPGEALSNIAETDLTLSKQRNGYVATYFLWSDVTKALPNFFTTQDHDRKLFPVNRYQKNTAIAYVHIPKAAGTTTNRCLENVAKKRKLKKPQNIWMSNYVQFFESLKSGQHKRQRAYFGLFSLGVCDFVDQPCSYFTIFRDPIERTISSYMYCKKASRDPICQAADAEHMTVRQWALTQGSVVFYQLLHNPEFCKARYDEEAVGLMEKKDNIRRRNVDIPCWYKQILLLEERLDREGRNRILDFILSNMEQLFAVIGLTDKYDETLQMLEKVYALPFYSVCAGDIKNKAAYKISGDNATDSKTITVEKLKQDLLEDPEVSEALHEDMEIYKEAVRIFKEQIYIFKRLS